MTQEHPVYGPCLGGQSGSHLWVCRGITPGWDMPWLVSVVLGIRAGGLDFAETNTSRTVSDGGVSLQASMSFPLFLLQDCGSHGAAFPGVMCFADGWFEPNVCQPRN